MHVVQDIVYAAEVGNKVAWIRSVGNSTFSTTESIVTVSQQGPNRAVAFDMDHDGDQVRCQGRLRGRLGGLGFGMHAFVWKAECDWPRGITCWRRCCGLFPGRGGGVIL